MTKDLSEGEQRHTPLPGPYVCQNSVLWAATTCKAGSGASASERLPHLYCLWAGILLLEKRSCSVWTSWILSPFFFFFSKYFIVFLICPVCCVSHLSSRLKKKSSKKYLGCYQEALGVEEKRKSGLRSYCWCTSPFLPLLAKPVTEQEDGR